MKKIKTTEELISFLAETFPVSRTTADDIIHWMKANKIEHSDVHENCIYASMIKNKSSITVTKWLMQFKLSGDNKLIEISVREGIIAP